MNIPAQYRIQSIIGFLQVFTVVIGMLTLWGALKAQGYRAEAHQLPLLLDTMTSYGYWLFLIPVVWTGGTIWLGQMERPWFSDRWSILSGVLVLALLGGVFAGSLVIAAGGVIIEYRFSGGE